MADLMGLVVFLTPPTGTAAVVFGLTPFRRRASRFALLLVSMMD